MGVTQLAQGERDEAIRHFTEADPAGNWIFSYGVGNNLPWASLFLERLREDPAWAYVWFRNMTIPRPTSAEDRTGALAWRNVP